MEILHKNIAKTDAVIWVHVASLGEYEQGLPVIEQLKAEYPSHKIVLTFFSPSGYEVKKNTTVADVVVYLPLDSKKKVSCFLNATHPELAIFVKYEIWPNYLKALKQRKIPSILISAIFNKNQIYFRIYGGFMRKALSNFTHYFVQNESSKSLLSSIGITNTTVSGDTRFDRVSKILERDNRLDFMEVFTQNSNCLVAGSTWPEDESFLINYINTASSDLKFVLAPHKIKGDNILKLKAAIQKPTALYSDYKTSDLKASQVLLIDHIGLLTRIYSYANYAYVGGGFATGLHNTLEPAIFGIPVVIGPHYQGFQEAEELVAKKGLISISNGQEFQETINYLRSDSDFVAKTGAINSGYISKNKGASIQIMAYIRTLI